MRQFPPLSEHDAVVVRANDYTDEQKKDLHLALRRTFPGWSGLILFFRLDQDISTLPEEILRQLYGKLKERFEPTAVDEPAGSDDS